MIFKLSVILAICYTICVSGAPSGQRNQQRTVDRPVAQIVRYDYEPTDTGYRFEYETSDGQTRREEGFQKSLDGGESILAVYGSYSYIGDDGVTYSVEYIADENGYRAVGAHLPGSQNRPANN